jgi:hypothetical protein
MASVDTSALAASSQTTGSASSAFFACHQLDATTATAVSPTCTTWRTPGMVITLAASKLWSLPP